jgi:hypothetical protein
MEILAFHKGSSISKPTALQSFFAAISQYKTKLTRIVP